MKVCGYAMAERPNLHCVESTAELPIPVEFLDPMAYQSSCVDRFVASQVARGFSPITIDNATGVLERFLSLAAKPAWELTAADVDAVVGTLIERGVGAVTRRGYIGAFKSFFAFLQARHAAEIESRFGVRLSDPLDVFHAGRHVSSDSPATRPPPTPQRMEEFFVFGWRVRASGRRRPATTPCSARCTTLYHAGLRSAEAASLEIRDLHFDRGPFGKVHVGLGKAARGSGPRPRWVPMLDDVALILRWYLQEVRPRFRVGGPVLFCNEGGGVMNSGSIRNRPAHLCQEEGRPAHERFSPHDLRHACATRNYERGIDLVAIQQMLGHWNVGTTMRSARDALGDVRRGRLSPSHLGDTCRTGRGVATGRIPLATKDGRRTTRGMDRGSAAPVVGRQGWFGVVCCLGVDPAHPPGGTAQARNARRVVHSVGLHPQRPARARHHRGQDRADTTGVDEPGLGHGRRCVGPGSRTRWPSTATVLKRHGHGRHLPGLRLGRATRPGAVHSLLLEGQTRVRQGDLPGLWSVTDPAARSRTVLDVRASSPPAQATNTTDLHRLRPARRTRRPRAVFALLPTACENAAGQALHPRGCVRSTRPVRIPAKARRAGHSSMDRIEISL